MAIMYRAVAIVAVAGMLHGAQPAAAGTPEASGSLEVRVYDAAGVSVDDLSRATATAQRIFAAAGVAIEWISCGPAAVECAAPLGAQEVSVRLVASQMPVNYRGQLPLGDALVDRAARAGSLATIYTSRVAWLAEAGQSEVAVLMGRAIAHEIGHLLLGTNGHAAHGLMRARWSAREVKRPAAIDWLFTPGDARHIRQALAERSASAAPQAAANHIVWGTAPAAGRQ